MIFSLTREVWLAGAFPALAEAGEAVSPRPLRARAGEAGDLSQTDRIHMKDHGDLATVRRIEEDMHGFVMWQG